MLRGTLAVDASVDSTGDFSGFEVLVATAAGAGAPDTLYRAETDSSGRFQGRYDVPARGLYPVRISRNGRALATLNTVLAGGETVELDVRFPFSDTTFSIRSPENEAYRTYDRVNRSFRRVAVFLQAGVLDADSTRKELRKWSDLFWGLYESGDGTYASQRAAGQSVTLLAGVDDSLMAARIGQSLDRDEAMLPGGIVLLASRRLADGDTLAAASVLEDGLDRADDPAARRQLYQALTRLHYDARDSLQGRRVLREMSKDLRRDSLSAAWVARWTPEFGPLAPGRDVPVFTAFHDGAALTPDSLRGAPFLLEFTRLSNSLYQEQFDELLVIRQLFDATGLEFVTLTGDGSPVLRDAFFEERPRLWVFADSVEGGWEALVERFNIEQVPTRLLVDREGRIHRKYGPFELDAILQGVQEVTAEQPGQAADDPSRPDATP